MKLEDNEFIGIISNDYGGPISLATTATDYLSIQRNKRRLSRTDGFITDTQAAVHDHATIKDNVDWSNAFLYTNQSSQWPDLDLSWNTAIGLGSFDDTRQFRMVAGLSGRPAKVQNNLVWRAMRILNYASFSQVIDNVLGHNYHHTINGPLPNGEPALYIQSVDIKRNLSIHARGDCSFAELGYNNDSHTDGATIEHNTVYDNTGFSGLSFGDESDLNGNQLMSRITQASNLVVLCKIGVKRIADISGMRSRVDMTLGDYNDVYGSTTADFSGFRFATIAGLVNVTGVSLFNPSFSSPVSGKTLALVVTSATNKTLAWDGGTPVQLIQETGTATSTPANYSASAGYLNDTAKTWTTDRSATTCPAGLWVTITGGTGAGQVRRVTANSATQLVVTPGWTTVPTATSTYTLTKSEVVLSNAGATATINAGLDLRLVPATSQSDTGVAVTFNGSSVDPLFADVTRDLETWDTSLGGPGTEDSAYARIYTDPTLTRTSLIPYLRAGFVPTNVAVSTAAHDGTTIGALAYAPPGGVADHLTVTTQPSSPIASGAAHATQPAGNVVTSAGATVTGDTSTVTATLVVEIGSATPLGTLTVAAVAGNWSFAGHGLGATSTFGATAHWHFTDGALTAVDSASFAITAAPLPAPPPGAALVIAGIAVPLLEGTAVENVEQGGSSERAQAGNLLSDCPWEKLTWQATTGLLTYTEVAALKAAIAFRKQVTCSGLIPVTTVTCVVTWSNGAYINTSTTDGTGILRSLVLLLRQV
jgi:hypothetical protein